MMTPKNREISGTVVLYIVVVVTLYRLERITDFPPGLHEHSADDQSGTTDACRRCTATFLPASSGE
jgi:hypothetical protein